MPRTTPTLGFNFATQLYNIISQAPPQPVDGFTPRKTFDDTVVVYVSEFGSDSNDGLTEQTPVQTKTRAFNLVPEGTPYWVLFKRGESFLGNDILNNDCKSGRNENEPALVSSYGSSPFRPKLYTTTRGIGQTLGLAFIEFTEIEWVFSSHVVGGPLYQPSDSHYQWQIQSDGNNILIEDCKFTGIEVVMQGGSGTERVKNIVFRRNITDENWYYQSSLNNILRPSNKYMSRCSNIVIEDNVYDYGGWHKSVENAGANQFNHGIYCNYSANGNTLIFRGNIISRASSHGMQARAGGEVDNNFFGRCAIGQLFGSNQGPMVDGANCSTINNVCSEGSIMAKGDNSGASGNLVNRFQKGFEFVKTANNTFFKYHQNVISMRDPNIAAYVAGNPNLDPAWDNLSFTAFDSQEFPNDGSIDPIVVDISGNAEYHYEAVDSGDGAGYPDPNRTAGTWVTDGLFESSTPGYDDPFDDDFDRFMNMCKSRRLGTWDDRLTADGLNTYIRAGYNVPGNATPL